MAQTDVTTFTTEVDKHKPQPPRDKRRLTDRTLQALKPAEQGKRYMVWDTKSAGFGVRVSDRGVRSFVVMRRRPGQRIPDRITLGTYPDMTLKDARDAAGEARKDLKRGVHPKVKEVERRCEEDRKRKDTFGAVAEEFIKRHLARLRTGYEVEGVIRRELIPRWGKRPITEITRRGVVEMLREIIDRNDRRAGVSYAAHHALAATRKMFNWAVASGLYGLDVSPCDRVSAKDVIGVKAKRTRVLTDHEVRLLWKASDELGYPLAPLVRLLLITGQRLREIAHGEWREIDHADALWTIPPARMKTGIVNELPLAPLALAIIGSLPRFQGGTFLFSTAGGKRPVSGFSKFKLRLDRAILRAHRRALGVPEDSAGLRRVLGLAATEDIPRDYAVDPWSFHDLRRTMRTRLSALPIVDEVRELMVAHKRPGLHQVYDQHSYREEKRRGFEFWATRLISIVEPPLGNVVPLTRFG